MVNLVIHAGGRHATREEVDSVAVPAATDTWHPVAHSSVIDTMLETLDGYGFAVARQEHALMGDGGERYFGAFDLRTDVVDGVGLVVGVRNSIDKSMAAGFCGGNRVFVCDNLAFTADIVVLRKHTRHILRDMRARFVAGIGQLDQFRQVEARRIERLQATAMSDMQAHDIMIRAAGQGVAPWSGLKAVAAEWKEPRHEEFRPRTAWSLVNAFTEQAKGRQAKNPADAADRTMRLAGVMAEAVA